MSQAFTFVAVDIETTGFAVDDEVTVLGFKLALGCRIFCQTGGQAVSGDSLAREVRDRVGEEYHLDVSTHDSEAALLEAVAGFTADRLCPDDDVLVVAYNGETYRGGFDLPFLRTRLASHDLAWLFWDVPYADLMPVISNRFNTHVDGDTQSDLDSVYEALCDGPLGEADPFAQSGEAVTAFQEGRLADLVQHNVVDILQTAALGRLAKRYCSKSDFQLKSLTPTIDATR